jgi:hypothetical protein
MFNNEKTNVYLFQLSFIRTNQDLVYPHKKNSYHLSMPNRQSVHDKTQEEKQVNQSILMAMNDRYTKKKIK